MTDGIDYGLFVQLGITTASLVGKFTIEVAALDLGNEEASVAMVMANTGLALIAACVAHPEWAAAIVVAGRRQSNESLDIAVEWIMEMCPVGGSRMTDEDDEEDDDEDA